MKTYESPVVKYNNIKLFEKIAGDNTNGCWSYKYAVFDDPYEDPDNGQYEVKVETGKGNGNGCGGGDLFPSAVQTYLSQKYSPAQYTTWLNQYNNNSNNYANTKADTGVSYLPS